ncbi:glycoside hydrolase family 18 protein, partial [Piromyces sp. E2]
DSEIETIRKNGGDIIISFGGSGGRELATVIEDEDELYNAYKSVIDYYKLSWIDLDIEGDVLKLNENANINRNKVMLRLKNEYPNLILAYCLGAEHTTGISNAGIKVLKHAKKIGLQVDVVNVMAMDFSRKETPDGDTKMGQYAIDTAKVAYEQVNEIGFKNTKIGITPMIGKNDHIQQIFTLNNAMEVLEFSQNNEWVRLLSFWALNRDNGDGGDTDETSNKYSSIEQEEFAFTNIFKNF